MGSSDFGIGIKNLEEVVDLILHSFLLIDFKTC